MVEAPDLRDGDNPAELTWLDRAAVRHRRAWRGCGHERREVAGQSRILEFVDRFE